MTVMYIKSNDCVLELGWNIGRNYCVIGKILNNSDNLLVIETDHVNVAMLGENNNINSINFKKSINTTRLGIKTNN
jgi:hypothetical protein